MATSKNDLLIMVLIIVSRVNGGFGVGVEGK